MEARDRERMILSAHADDFNSEDGFEQTEPWSEEEQAWQQHISDEQRKHDVSLKVEALLRKNPFNDRYSSGI